MPAWVIWLIIAVGLGIAEMLSLTFDLALLAVAALVATGAAALGFTVGVQFAVFAATAALMILVVRPIARRHLQGPPVMRSGAAALVGREAVVVDEVTRSSGLVRIGGEEWTARPYDSSVSIAAGTLVDVLAIDGATALVHPREEPWALS
ncbi:MAG TPA: NfeD family protein [Actinopolymorphaceae bacterium]